MLKTYPDLQGIPVECPGCDSDPAERSAVYGEYYCGSRAYLTGAGLVVSHHDHCEAVALAEKYEDLIQESLNQYAKDGSVTVNDLDLLNAKVGHAIPSGNNFICSLLIPRKKTE